MKILLIHQYFLTKNGTGGSRFNEMVDHWASQGHQITVLCGMVYHNSGKKYPQYRGKFFVREVWSDNVIIIRCHDSENGQKNFFSRLKVYLTFVFTSIWAGIFRVNGKFDVILVSSPPLFVAISAIFLSIFKRAPYIFEIRDLWPESAIDTGILKNNILIFLSFKFEKYVYKLSKGITVLTPAFREKLIKNKSVPDSKIIYIPNAADFRLSSLALENFDREKFRKNLNIDKNQTVLCYVGAHGIANGLDTILDTALLLKSSNVVFLIIGDGMMKKKLTKRAIDENIENVKFIDPVSKLEVFKYIAASDIGLSVLIRNETFKTVFSNKTFDYMSCKLPVLVAIDGVSRDLIETANCGLYVEPENEQDFADKILFYKENSDLLAKHGLNGFKYAMEHFDRSKLANKYISRLESLLNL